MLNLISISRLFLLGFFAYFLPFSILAAEIIVKPPEPIQGEPILITLEGISATSSISKAEIGKSKLHFFVFESKVKALYGFDLSSKPSTTTIAITLKDGSILKKDVVVKMRDKIEAPLEIPEKLGGNTKAAAQKIVNNLVNEQEVVSKLTSKVRPKAFWSKPFSFPVKTPVITDTYGYSRDTVGYQITHKGLDFKANEDTPIYPINRGVVRGTGVYPTFGKTIIVDHGLGLYSMYLHLSKVKVNVGELVLPQKIIGFAGDSGYATGPHLHLSIRLNGSSIDPAKFFELFNLGL